MSIQTKILIVEHNLNDIELILRELKTGGINFISEIVQNEQQYRNELKVFIPDIILCDYSLPSFDGHTAFEIREDVAADTPFIFVSGSIGEENSIEYIKKGVTDYVLKDRLITLVIKVKRALTDAKERREKSKINNEFRQALKDLQKIMTASLDVICAINKEGEFVNVSSASENIFGFKPEELKGRKYIDFVFPGDVESTTLVVAGIMNGTPVTFFENKCIQKNGNLVPVLWSATWDDDDKLMYCIAKDAAERIEAEQLRKFDQNNLNALINNTKDLMWSVDKDFKLITSNKPFDDVMLFMTGRLIVKGENILDADFSNKQITQFKKAYQRAFAEESFTEIEYRETPIENWAAISYCPINNGNEIIGVACHSRDITQLKINERTIKDERILLKTLIDNLPSSVYTKDINSRKTLSNRKDYEFAGAHSEEEVLGKDDSCFFSTETSNKSKTEEQQIFNTGKPILNKEEYQKKKDGTSGWFLISKIPLRNRHNKIVGLAGVSHDISEIKKTEQQLKKSEAFNRGVLNSLSSHIAVINASGNIIAVNDAWKQFGIENGATNFWGTAVGSNYYEVCKKSGDAGIQTALEVLQGMKDVMDEKASFFYTEYPCHSPNEQRWFNIHVMKFESDEPMIVVSHYDITKRKLAEEAMSLTQFAVDNAGDAIFWMEPGGRIVNVNQAACHLLNYSKEEILTLSVTDIDPNYSPEKWSIQFEELRQKKSLFFETIQRSKDGRLMPVEIRTTYIKFGDKELNCAFVRDITERKKAEKNQLQSESRLLEAQAIAHVGNWEVDLETTLQTWSDEYYNILGVTKEEAHPSLKYYLSFVHNEDVDSVKKVIEENDKTSDPLPYEFRFIRKDGVTRFGYAQSRFEFDKNNKPVRLFGVIQDITERKLAEFRLEQQNSELKKINFELDRFVYSVSHELRAPLTSVLGLTSFIEDESKETDILEYAGLIRTSINRLDNFIKNILSYSRNKRTEPEIKEIPIIKTVNEIVDSLRHMKEAEGIHFEVNIKEPVSFFSDPLSFKTITENLISNAIKFQKEELPGRHIEISGHSDKHNLHLHIKDNGIGIPSRYHFNIFQMFFRLSGKTGGSGIGLYIVKEMIDKLQGSVKVESKEEAGTSFTIQLKNLAV